MTKCKPLKCRRFMRIFEKAWDKVPVDLYLLHCPNRHGKTKYGTKCRHFQKVRK